MAVGVGLFLVAEDQSLRAMRGLLVLPFFTAVRHIRSVVLGRVDRHLVKVKPSFLIATQTADDAN